MCSECGWDQEYEWDDSGRPEREAAADVNETKSNWPIARLAYGFGTVTVSCYLDWTANAKPVSVRTFKTEAAAKRYGHKFTTKILREQLRQPIAAVQS